SQDLACRCRYTTVVCRKSIVNLRRQAHGGPSWPVCNGVFPLQNRAQLIYVVFCDLIRTAQMSENTSCLVIIVCHSLRRSCPNQLPGRGPSSAISISSRF